MEYQTITNTFTPDTVKNLEIEAACSKVSFDQSPDEEIHVDARLTGNGVYTCEMKQNTLLVSYDCYRMKILGRQDYENPFIVISLPDNFIFEQIDCDIAAGKVLMEKVPVSCHNMNITVAAGTWKANHLSVLHKLTAESGAGKIKLNKTNVGSLHLECGAAKCSYEGRIEKNFRVSCGVGTCKFRLENSESDFDFNTSCALGTILINERKISSFSKEKHCGTVTAPGKGILECGVGKIILETTCF